MSKKKLILPIALSIIGVAILTICVLLLKDTFVSKSDGTIQIVLVDIEGNTVSDKKIDFNEGDKLVDLLNHNYKNVVITDSMIMSIEDFTTASDWSEFILIYVDDEMSMVGVLDIEFTDGTKISFVMTKYVQS